MQIETIGTEPRMLKTVFFQHLVADKSSRYPKMNELDLSLTLECINSVEVLMTSPNLQTSNENCSSAESNAASVDRIEKLLMFLIPVLVSHLIVNEDGQVNSVWKEKLNEFSLNKINEIGRRWPQQFLQVYKIFQIA